MSLPPHTRALLAVTAIVLGVGWANRSWQDWRSDRIGERVAAAARPGDIRMLSSEVCEYCTAARTWFGAHRVPFAECFIERDAACAAEFDRAQAPGTPLLIVRGQRQRGFQAQAVADALGAG
jgi:glutaredoxin